MPLETHEVEAKKPALKTEEVIMPRYKFKDVEKEITVLKEIPAEAFGKDEILKFANTLKDELVQLREIIRGLVRYQIKEREIISQVVKLQDVKVINPILEDVKVKNPILEDVRIKNPILEDVKVPQVSQKDIEALTTFKKLADEVLSKLKEIKDCKIQEEIVKREILQYVPKKIEIPSEKIVLHVKDEVIESLEELVKTLKKQK